MTSPFINIAVEAARGAGRLIMRAFERPDLLKIDSKNVRDIVTDVDRAAEKFIVDHLLKTYPDHAILAEESGAQGKGPVTWIIDPIDGTKNFANQCPHFCISIAMQFEGKTEYGVIYDPVRDELFTATAGRGAQLNGRRLRIQAPILDQLLFALEPAVLSRESALIFAAQVARLAPVVSELRMTGSAALDLAYLAAGRFQAFLGSELNIWDVAAGVLLVQEAGGLVTNWKGDVLDFNVGEIFAAHPKIFKQLLPIIT